MLKNHFLFCFLCAVALPYSGNGQSRYSYGVCGGLNFSTFFKTASTDNQNAGHCRIETGVEHGLFIQYKIKPRSFVRTGFELVRTNYLNRLSLSVPVVEGNSQIAYQSATRDAKVSDRYILVPLEFGVYTPAKRKNLSLYGGFGICGIKYTSSTSEVTINSIPPTAPVSYSNSKDNFGYALSLFGGADFCVAKLLHFCLEPNVLFLRRQLDFGYSNGDSYFLFGLKARVSVNPPLEEGSVGEN
jgi:hypothetical protein